MASPLDLSLQPPTPTPATAAAASAAFRAHRPIDHRARLQLQQPTPSSSSSSSFSPAKPRPAAARKPNPSAPKITMPCSECGRKFWSWKALYGHMRCHPNRQWRGINPPPHLRRPPDASPSPEDHEAASCLLLLANTHQSAGGYAAEGPTAGLGHRCGICFKVFSTGQALGGHKRSHWEKSSFPSGSGGGGGAEAASSSSPGGRGGGGLDLNLPTPQSEEVPGGGDLQLVLRLGF